MDKPKFRSTHKEVLDRLLLGFPHVKAGKMFGYPAYYVGRKLFACVYEDGVGVKIPQVLAGELLARPEIVPFQPLGKPRMREWVQIVRENSADFQKDMEIFRASIEFVGGDSPSLKATSAE